MNGILASILFGSIVNFIDSGPFVSIAIPHLSQRSDEANVRVVSLLECALIDVKAVGFRSDHQIADVLEECGGQLTGCDARLVDTNTLSPKVSAEKCSRPGENETASLKPTKLFN